MYFTVYKTTNLINGKFYIGVHKTDNLEDRYLGSGKMLLRSILKHGVQNFKKEILYIFDNSSDMFLKEKEIITEDFCKNPITYNIKLGGQGGWDHIDNKGKVYSKESRKKMSISGKRKIADKNPFYGKRHSDETKQLIGKSSKERAKTNYIINIEKGVHPNSAKESCPHCGKCGQLRAMRRWHFDNCKQIT